MVFCCICKVVGRILKRERQSRIDNIIHKDITISTANQLKKIDVLIGSNNMQNCTMSQNPATLSSW